MEFMATLGECSVDSVVTDPPYGLLFMGKSWDHGVPGEAFWVEMLRVSKPGSHLLAFGGTRTFHRLMCAIEDAGWEIRDTIMWVYGSGFPKSLNVSKQIDKAAGAEREVIERRRTKGGGTEHINRENMTQEFRPNSYQKGENILDITAPSTESAKQWDGWGTALKPSWEPIIVARKPLVGTVARNVQDHGTGALNIDGCRVVTDSSVDDPRLGGAGTWSSDKMAKNVYEGGYVGERVGSSALGRFPANLIHDGSDDVLELFPSQKSGANPTRRGSPKFHNSYGVFEGQESCEAARGAESGSAARFFYSAKASRSDRTMDGQVENKHPTVKPNSLMRYLCRLVTPPGGLILDPFCGSGSTGVAAVQEGFRFVGAEQDADSAATAMERVRLCQP